ncbi:MAG: hypothetical protein ACR2KK_14050 [Acidimicrobiales bacterium]
MRRVEQVNQARERDQVEPALRILELEADNEELRASIAQIKSSDESHA